ncbi:MAG: chemotaxis protein CheW [Rhodospirillales bacterium]
MNAVSTAAAQELIQDSNVQQILTTTVGNQVFGIPVLSIQDILQPKPVAHVPKAPADVAGLINLRGRIVTVINLRHWLGFEATDNKEQMHIVVEHEGELYSFLVDSVGDVVSINLSEVEAIPPNLPDQWQKISKNVLRYEKDLILIVDVSVLITALASN